METVRSKTEGKAKSKMGVTNWKQRTQERKQWKETIEQAKTHKEL
jgi:hypothetical protein